jgi:glutathione S-transferase
MVMLFASEEGIDLDYKLVDLFTGEHLKPEFSNINASRLIPVLEDGDFRLSESSAILKYLADKTGSSAYPKDLKQRARVNEMMDWFNANFYKDYGYGLIYSQLFRITNVRATRSTPARWRGVRRSRKGGSRFSTSIYSDHKNHTCAATK